MPKKLHHSKTKGWPWIDTFREVMENSTWSVETWIQVIKPLWQLYNSATAAFGKREHKTLIGMKNTGKKWNQWLRPRGKLSICDAPRAASIKAQQTANHCTSDYWVTTGWTCTAKPKMLQTLEMLRVHMMVLREQQVHQPHDSPPKDQNRGSHHRPE